MVFQHILSLLLLLCSSQLVFADGNSTATSCSDRRCLANSLISQKLLSAPQNDNCSIVVNVTSIQYETLSFDTKAMEMSSRIKVNMEWKDPDLGWTLDKYRFPTIVLPMAKIWIPQIVLDNAIDTTVEPYTNDIQVRRDGVVSYAAVLFTTVSCEINLFTYPFVSGSCPVAINGWSQKTCELKLQISDDISLTGASRGEWQTTNIVKNSDSTDRVYLEVSLSINPFSAFMTLILPSGLLLLADLVCFAMPYEGGERNTFKVTLVLSLTMFLLILNDHLPNGGNCSPLLNYHFGFCLVCLVVSMLISIVLTRLSVDDSLICRFSSKVHPSDIKTKHDSLDQEMDTGVITTKSGDLASEAAGLQKILNFVETLEKDKKERERKMAFAYYLDKFCFGFFVIIYIIYVIVIFSITQTSICTVNNLDFWDTSAQTDSSFDYSSDA